MLRAIFGSEESEDGESARVPAVPLTREGAPDRPEIAKRTAAIFRALAQPKAGSRPDGNDAR